MKLLFDNNISFRVVKYFARVFPESIHVADKNMDANTEDETIWRFAINNGYTILTKDNDFESMSRLYGCPPKVIQLICGNKSTSEIISILKNNSDSILSFDSDEENCLMFLK